MAIWLAAATTRATTSPPPAPGGRARAPGRSALAAAAAARARRPAGARARRCAPARSRAASAAPARRASCCGLALQQRVAQHVDLVAVRRSPAWRARCSASAARSSWPRLTATAARASRVSSRMRRVAARDALDELHASRQVGEAVGVERRRRRSSGGPPCRRRRGSRQRVLRRAPPALERVRRTRARDEPSCGVGELRLAALDAGDERGSRCWASASPARVAAMRCSSARRRRAGGPRWHARRRGSGRARAAASGPPARRRRVPPGARERGGVGG